MTQEQEVLKGDSVLQVCASGLSVANPGAAGHSLVGDFSEIAEATVATENSSFMTARP